MSEGVGRVLLIGYGNPGRLDDGLGPALAEAVAELDLPNVTVDSDYQLTVEDSAQVAEHDVVVFADADVAGLEPFTFRRISPRMDLSFSSHDCDPQSVLALAHDLLKATTAGYVLAIRGYEFNEFGESLSLRARANLREALDFIDTTIRERSFESRAAEQGEQIKIDGPSLSGDQR